MHTRDLDLSLLDQNDVPSVIDSKIYFNEVLTKQKYIYFKSLKDTAKKLCFKYTWHRKGSFLVKWRDGERSHVFKTTADLHILASSYLKDKAMHTSGPLEATAWLAHEAEGTRARSLKGLKAAFLNACSLKGHIEKIRQYFRDNPGYDIFGVAETCFHPLLDDSAVIINGYSLIRQDRNTQGGGVALYIHNNYKFTVLATSDTTVPGKSNIIEYIMGYVNIGNSDPIFVSSVYRPPDVSLRNDPYLAGNLKLYVGDFNTNLLTTSKDETFLRDLTSDLALKVVEHGPTNFTTAPGKWVDVIFVNADDTITETGNRPAPFHNTHNIINVTLDRSTPTLSCTSFSYRPYNKIHSDELNSFLPGYN